MIKGVGNCCLRYSGGGVTARSVPEAEYQELHDKVYVPVT